MNTFQKKINVTWSTVANKALVIFGLSIWYLLVLILKILEHVLDMFEHGGDTEDRDIGGHYNVHSGDFDSVQQYDGVYSESKDNPPSES